MTVSRETKLYRPYYEMLRQWNQKFNLVGLQTVSSFEEFLRQHGECCFDLISVLPKNPVAPFVDIGSGAGLPGIIMALNQLPVILVEPNQKRVAFLREVIRYLNLANCSVVADRFETLPPQTYGGFTARAVAPLETLLKMTVHVSRETPCYFIKGEHWQEEVEEAQKTQTFVWTHHKGNIIEIQSRG